MYIIIGSKLQIVYAFAFGVFNFVVCRETGKPVPAFVLFLFYVRDAYNFCFHIRINFPEILAIMNQTRCLHLVLQTRANTFTKVGTVNYINNIEIIIVVVA